MKYILSVLLTLFFVNNVSFAQSCPQYTDTGFCWPTGTSSIGSYIGWHGYNPSYHGKKHLAKDISANEGDSIYAIAEGTVVDIRTNVDGYGGFSIPGGGMIIRHNTTNGKVFDVQNAHVKNFTVSIGDSVVRGQKIAEVGPYYGGKVHLHFGITYPAGSSSNPWAGYGVTDDGFVDPMAFMNTNTPYSISAVEKDVYVNGDIGWYPSHVSCEDATRWYNIYRNDPSPLVATTATSSVCSTQILCSAQ